jgi:hypothetical protein
MSDHLREVSEVELAALELARDTLAEPLHVHAHELLRAARDCAKALDDAQDDTGGFNALRVQLARQRLLYGIWAAEGRPAPARLPILTPPPAPACTCAWVPIGLTGTTTRVPNTSCPRHSRDVARV